MAKVINFMEAKARKELERDSKLKREAEEKAFDILTERDLNSFINAILGENHYIDTDDVQISPKRIEMKETSINQMQKHLYPESPNFFREPVCVEPKTIDESLKEYFEDIQRFTIEKKQEDGTKSLVVLNYEEIMLKLVREYGIENLKAFYMKTEEESFNILMELFRLYDLEYKDLTEEEKINYIKVLVQLQTDDCYSDM